MNPSLNNVKLADTEMYGKLFDFNPDTFEPLTIKGSNDNIYIMKFEPGGSAYVAPV